MVTVSKREWSILYSLISSGLLQNIRSIQEHPPLKKWVGLLINWVYPAVEVKVSNSLPAFESISAAHQLVHLALKSPISTEENGEVSSIFVNVKWRLWQ